MINEFSLDDQSKNYLVISSDIVSRYETIIAKVSEYFDKSIEKILENPDVMYVSLPVIDKSGNITSTLSNSELQMREYGLLDKIDSNRIGNEITIDQIREVISFTQISAHKNKKIVILNSASNMNMEASSALLKTLEEVSSNCTFILLASSLNSIAETIISRCQVLQHERDFEIKNNSNFQEFFFSKHPFLKNIDPDYNIFDLTEGIKVQIDGLLNKTLDPIDVSNEWSALHLNLIVCIVVEYIIFNCKSAIYKPLDHSLDQYYKKLVNIYTKSSSIKKNIDLNINTKYLLNNLTIELAS
ncbi:MAG: hypothetical protein VYE09_00865 [Pseudomonadota bacterium]|nr:hypothetical protein [Pseudomonadota bacterium]